MAAMNGALRRVARRPRGERRLLVAAAVVAAAVVAWGALVHAATGGLGTAAPPFVMAFSPGIDVLVLAGVAAGAALVAIGPRLLAAPRSPAGFAVVAGVLALGVALAVNAAHEGVHGWWRVFDLGPGGSFEAKNEVIAGLPALSYGTGFFLDRFAELAPALPVNVAGHPPGLPVLMHWTGIDDGRELAALCAGALAGIAPATYALGRSLAVSDRRARLAALLACASPALVLFGVSSPDALFALAGTICAALLVSRRPALRAAGCVALGIAALLSWLLLAIGAWAVLVAALRDGPRRALAIAAGCAVAVAGVDAVLWLASGYDAIGTLRATERVYRHSLARERPYAFWVLGSPVAFAVMAGPAVAGASLAGAARRGAAALALVTIVAVSALLGLTKAEVERIWLPFVPLACVAAACVLPLGRTRLALATLVAQALVVEILFATVW